jgi:hypothetical protein
MPEDTGPVQPDEAVHNPERSPWVWLLALPLLLLIYPPLYNRTDPELLGLPFFYWYQLATVPIAVACTSVLFVVTRRSR